MLQQVFIINTDVKMPKGKMAVQVAHGLALYMCDLIKHDDKEKCLESELMKKIVLKSTTSEMEELHDKLISMGINVYCVFDKETNCFTCDCIEPLDEEQNTDIFGHLELF
jgi:peptidyl-tRNA hydrolase